MTEAKVHASAKPPKWREKAKPTWRRYIAEAKQAEALSEEYFAEWFGGDDGIRTHETVPRLLP
jgi:hypothetical protein